jgi:hypothetical protein
MLPPACSSTTFSRPIVHNPGEAPLVRLQFWQLEGAALVERDAARRREALASRVAEIRLRRSQVAPVGRCLDAGSHRGYEITLDAEQPLDGAL